MSLNPSSAIGPLQLNPRELAQVSATRRAGWKAAIENLGGVGAILIQLALIALVMRELDMQTSAFRRVFYIATGGFLINHFLPQKLRMAFFATLSIGAMVLILGGGPVGFNPVLGLQRTGVIVGLGAVIIGICNLPLGYWMRAGLLTIAGCALGWMRVSNILPTPLAMIWPILAAMFMLRIFIYLYDHSASKQRPTISQSLGYFFMIPNVCITLFPVIDFKTFCRSHYDQPAMAIYQKGVRWMVRGLIQLILYRFIDLLLSIKAQDVSSGTMLIQYILTNSFLYLKISGGFHLIVGMLHLFGFDLPEGNHRYFLASSFTDYWRRVNIYWKDFMMKVFYYPTFFKLNKKIGQSPALMVATLWCFVVTWFFHRYQTWWLKGSVDFSVPDAIFWLVLGVLVLANSLWEIKKGRQRKLTTTKYTVGSSLRLMIQTALTFAGISLLWSIWSSDSFATWIGLWKFADLSTLLWASAALSAIMLATLFFEILPKQQAAVRKAEWGWDSIRCAAVLAAICVIAHPIVRKRIDSARLQPYEDVIATGDSLIAGMPADRGYYESLTKVDEADKQLWETFLRQRIDYGYTGYDPVAKVRDFRFGEPLPNIDVDAWTTHIKNNSFGMRDKEYALATPPATVRIALLGSSNPMGWGIKENERFESLMEERLNRESPGSKGVRYEILNFSARSYSPLADISVMEHKAEQFHPEIVLLVSHLLDFEWSTRDLHRCLREGIPLPEYLQEVADEARILKRTHPSIAIERLRPYEPEVLQWSYKQVVSRAKQANALPVLVFLPLPYELTAEGRQKAGLLLDLARNAGFITIDLSSTFEGRDPTELHLNEPWRHFNPMAHGLIADSLYKQLTTNPQIDLASRARKATTQPTH